MAKITTNTLNGNITITPNGTGEVDISKVDIDGGTIDGTTIGGTTPAAGAFTTITSTGTTTLGGNLVIPDSGTIGSESDTDAITIDSSGNVGIGSSPSQRLTVATETTTDGAFNPAIRVGLSGTSQGGVIGSRTAAGNQRQGLYVSSSQTLTLWGDVLGDGSGVLDVVSGSSPSAGTDANSLFRIDSSGHVYANTFKNLAGTGAPDFPNGLTLAGNTTSGNITGVTLDDYEEGTWTPTSGTFATFTSVTATAKYIKIGNLVFVYFLQTGGTIDPGAAIKYLEGLPFAPDSSGGSGSWSDGSVTFNVTALISVSAGTGRIWTPVDFGSTINLCFSGTYYTS